MKTSKHLFFAVFLFFAVYVSKAQTYNLVWADEFNTSIGPDWVFETGTGSGGWGNNELEYYRPENASVSGGNLVITARREAFGGMQYTSARMKTQGRRSFRFGRIEARIAMPSFQGVWPAFWMLGDNITTVGWPACGEIDIMEHVNTGNTTHGTIHWDANGTYANYGGSTNPNNITTFHTYSVDWTTDYIRWFVDGVQFFEANISGGINGTSEFQNNFFILLNMAIGGNWPGFVVDNNAFPANMLVDYVRVYQLGTTPTATIPGTIQAESYNAMSGVQLETTTDAGGGQNVGWIETGDYMDYNVNVTTAGTYTVGFRVASSAGGGQVQIRSGATTLGTANVAATGGWQSWTTVTTTVNLSAGQQTLRVYAAAGGFNINWIEFGTSSNNGNLALGRPATASSVENSTLPASNAVDASLTTRWSSAFSDPQWIYVDLGQNYAINRVKLTWEAAYGRDYQVQISTDASTWTTIRTVTGNTTLINDLTGLSGTGRYVRINGTVRGTAYGYSLFGFEVYGASTIARMGIDEDNKFEVYPSPVNNTLNITGIANGASVIVSRAEGLPVLKAKIENGMLDVHTLPQGIYTISIIDGKNRKVTKFIKN